MSLPPYEIFLLYFKALERRQEERNFQAWLHTLPIMALSGEVREYTPQTNQRTEDRRMTEEDKDRILNRAIDISNRFKEMRGD
ncbi:hypothetical protein BK722_12925 [Bacillus thuringiensis serovar finitimus]|nr:hypothetical protein YBT020_05615 [Bacillus thuringiensis serovar finitimus YBT-020]OTX71311.1 hypothetical protein BK722_12925 [Bacillus thuringiensis serovar finitimus]PGZ45691.1 hypothetical protein COE56_25765 [Bacillus anthracis]